MKRVIWLATALFTVVMLTSASLVIGSDVCELDRAPNPLPSMENETLRSGALDTYEGTIRVFVSEIVSRWYDNDGHTFHNALLSFALQEAVAIADGDSLTWDLTWNGNNYVEYNGQDFGDLAEDNCVVTAAVFNVDFYQGYSYGTDGPFWVHEVDASASATPGNTGYHIITGPYTHSIFIDDASTTW
jgi:hypothetical protein